LFSYRGTTKFIIKADENIEFEIHNMEKNGTVISHETNAYLESLDGMNLAELKDAEARAKIALLVIAKLVVISE
jgi:hypothetical protein